MTYELIRPKNPYRDVIDCKGTRWYWNATYQFYETLTLPNSRLSLMSHMAWPDLLNTWGPLEDAE